MVGIFLALKLACGPLVDRSTVDSSSGSMIRSVVSNHARKRPGNKYFIPAPILKSATISAGSFSFDGKALMRQEVHDDKLTRGRLHSIYSRQRKYTTSSQPQLLTSLNTSTHLHHKIAGRRLHAHFCDVSNGSLSRRHYQKVENNGPTWSPPR